MHCAHSVRKLLHHTRTRPHGSTLCSNITVHNRVEPLQACVSVAIIRAVAGGRRGGDSAARSPICRQRKGRDMKPSSA